MAEAGEESGAQNLRVVGENEGGSEDMVGEYLGTLNGNPPLLSRPMGRY